MKDVLKPDEFQFFKHLYNIDSEGNFLEETTKTVNGKNIIYLKDEFENFAKTFSLQEEMIRAEADRIKLKLKTIRDDRQRPSLDDKILTDWNGLMIASLAYGGQILNEIKYTDHAERAAYFIYKNLRKKNGRLLKSFRNECADISPHFDDYAYLSLIHI